jgi:Sec-independent protein secretion pathway component TatC
MINKLNTFFSKMGGTSANTDYSNQNFAKLEHCVHSKVPSQIEFKIPMIQIDETKALLAKLDVSKATGLADVGPYFLKLSAEFIAPCITYLINLSIVQGIFPSSFILAKITPLFESGGMSLPENYRPISVLPTLSKNVENM